MLKMISGFATSAKRLALYFQDSRDRWKTRATEYQARIRKLAVRVYDLEKSRDRWKEQAIDANQRLAELEAQLPNDTNTLANADNRVLANSTALTAASPEPFSICS